MSHMEFALLHRERGGVKVKYILKNHAFYFWNDMHAQFQSDCTWKMSNVMAHGILLTGGSSDGFLNEWLTSKLTQLLPQWKTTPQLGIGT